MKDEIIISGYGGQGIVLTGNLIANTAMQEGYETCGMVSYGVEMRGGTANSSVIISDDKIGSPIITNPNTAIIMNEPSLEKYENKVKKNGLVILNISECKKKVARKDLKVIEIDATSIAEKIGNKKVANLIMVGGYIKNRGILNIESAKKMIKKVMPKAKDEIIELNKKALIKGFNIKGE